MSLKFAKQDVSLAAITCGVGVAISLAAFLSRPDTTPRLSSILADSAGLWLLAGVAAFVELVVLWFLYGSLRTISLTAGLGLLLVASWWVGIRLFG
jgi:hypothetical protein